MRTNGVDRSAISPYSSVRDQTENTNVEEPEINGLVAPVFVRRENTAGILVSLIIVIAIALSLLSPALPFSVYGFLAAFFIANSWLGREGLSSRRTDSGGVQ